MFYAVATLVFAISNPSTNACFASAAIADVFFPILETFFLAFCNRFGFFFAILHATKPTKIPATTTLPPIYNPSPIVYTPFSIPALLSAITTSLIIYPSTCQKCLGIRWAIFNAPLAPAKTGSSTQVIVPPPSSSIP